MRKKIEKLFKNLLTPHITIIVNGEKIDPTSKEGKEILKETNQMFDEFHEMMKEFHKMMRDAFK